MPNFNKGSGPLTPRTPTQAVADQINARIDQALAAKDAATGRGSGHRRIGAAAIGNECLRAIAYQYMRAPKKEPAGRMRRIWQRGHAAEDRIISWLRLAGYTVIDRGANGQQIGFNIAENRIMGQIDGVVTAGPTPLPYPLMLELKCINNRSWNDLAKKGLRTSKPVYYGQIHICMGYLDLRHCLFGAENADNEELFWEVFPYDQAEAQRMSDRGVDVIRTVENGDLPPRIASNPSFFKCKWCDFAETCWSDER